MHMTSSSIVEKAASSSLLRARSWFNSFGEVNGLCSPSPLLLTVSSAVASALAPRILRNMSTRCSCDAPFANIPAPIIFFSRSSFSTQRASMCRSTPESVISLNTRTSRFWPKRCDLATACLSFCGFQSKSKKITVSAVCKFNPRPPARADSRKTSPPFPLLNSSSRLLRSSCGVLPSSLRWLMARHCKYACRTSSIDVNCEKMSILCPKRNNFGSMRSKTSTLPETRKISSFT
mmetsp:Transcript_3497/g.6680  ORF Transcript_3497/g.6680 Transcript_3497/m.6680 type:complete len:234 (-) Transcript_3497:1849-2550(-)